jgi:hypothetical protein
MCPWEVFREVALQLINLNCIEEPLQSTVKAMAGENAANSEDDNNNDYEDWKVILVTISVSICVFALFFAGYVFWSKKHAADHKAVLSSSVL